MSQCMVPKWNLKHQRQEQVKEDHQEEQQEQGKRSSHVLKPRSVHLVPMSNYDIAELTWENGQLAMLGHGGLIPSAQTKPTWGRSSDTLESVVHQATTCYNEKQNFNLLQHDQTPANRSSIASSSRGNWAERSGRLPLSAAAAAAALKKRARSDSDQCRKNYQSGGFHPSACACASASATFCTDNDTTMLTWASHGSPQSQSMKTKTTDEDSACHDGSENQDEDRETRDEAGRSYSTRRNRAAAIHNLSERRRRDRINQKMKTLQKLVPNASKRDKASMLDEVIEYLKQLQAQVQMMSMGSMTQMMLPLGMQQQQQLQMALLARMGMGVGLGMGMGMLDVNSMAARNASQSLPHLMHPSPVTSPSTPSFLPPPFVASPLIPTAMAGQANSDATSNASVTLPDPYCAFLAQSMNMELYSKMAALYRPQTNQTTATQKESSPSRSNNVQEN